MHFTVRVYKFRDITVHISHTLIDSALEGWCTWRPINFYFEIRKPNLAESVFPNYLLEAGKQKTVYTKNQINAKLRRVTSTQVF